MVARLKLRGSEAGLREYLLEDAVRLRDACGGLDADFWRELSKPVDQLVGGETCRLHRYELPDDHPMRMAGGMGDLLVLTAADELMAA